LELRTKTTMDDSWIYTLNSDIMRKDKERLKGQGIVISNLISKCQNRTDKEKEYLKILEFMNSIEVLVHFAEQALIWTTRSQLRPGTQIPSEAVRTLTYNDHESLKQKLGAIAVARASILRKKGLMQFHSLSELGNNPADLCETEKTIVLMKLEAKLLQLEHLYKSLLEIKPVELKMFQ
jgi:hypothetical protein